MDQQLKLQTPMKVAILTNVVPAYRRPVFEALHETPGVCLRLFLSFPTELSDRKARISLNIKHSRGLNLKWTTRYAHVGAEYTKKIHIPLGLFVDVLRYRPDLVVSAEFGLRSLVGYGVAKVLRIPLLLWTEEIAERAKATSYFQRRLRTFLIPRARAFLAWGEPAVGYLRQLGVSEEKIHYCAQAVDNEAWARECGLCDRQRARSELSIRGKAFLAVGRLVEGKGFQHLLLAWSRLAPTVRENNTLIIVGNGPEEEKLRHIVVDRGLNSVLFAGWQSGISLAKYYAAADVFVFPSLVDVWGLVVNEAMACGLPVLGSRFAGASQQLLKDKNVGLTFDPTDLEGFACVLSEWATRADEIPRERPAAVVSSLSFEVAIEALRRAITLYAKPRGRLAGQPKFAR